MHTISEKIDYPRTLNLQQAADFLGCHWQTLRKMAKKGQIPAKKLGKTWRFYQPDLVIFLRSEYFKDASQGVINIKEVTTWHFAKEEKFGGSDLVKMEIAYKKALGLPIAKKHYNTMTK